MTSSIAAIVLSSERVLYSIVIKFVLIVVGFVCAIFSGAARKPHLEWRPDPADKSKLGRQGLDNCVPRAQRKDDPDVGGLQCVSRRVETKLSRTPNRICWPDGWRLRVTRATISTGVKGGLQNEAGSGATPSITCPAASSEGVEPML